MYKTSAMKNKANKRSSHILHIYIGYGQRGAEKELAIRKAISSTGQNISSVIISLLKAKFPDIGL